MSMASRQTLTILSLIRGVLKTFRDRRFAPEVDAAVLYASDVSLKCVTEFPLLGDEFKNQQWVFRKLMLFRDVLPSQDELIYSGSMVYICSHLITDLYERIGDPVKKRLLEPLEEACRGLVDLLDPEGDNIEAMTKADALVEFIYREIEFGRKQ